MVNNNDCCLSGTFYSTAAPLANAKGFYSIYPAILKIMKFSLLIFFFDHCFLFLKKEESQEKIPEISFTVIFFFPSTVGFFFFSSENNDRFHSLFLVIFNGSAHVLQFIHMLIFLDELEHK